MRSVFFIALCLFTASHAMAAGAGPDDPAQAPRLPRPVTALTDRIAGCQHWAGEEAYDAARARQIKRAVAKLRCDRLEKDEAAVLNRYRADPHVREAIDAAKNGTL